MARVLEKSKAINLRKQGYTYREILNIIPGISKGTLSYWCNRIDLTTDELKKIESRSRERSEKARLDAALTNRRKRREREEIITDVAKKEFNRYKNEEFFSFGLALYWAEGSKKFRRFQFTNSDPYLAKIMLRWMQKYLKIGQKEFTLRLYIHKVYSYQNCEGFWSKTLGVPEKKFLKTVYKPSPHKIKKNENYMGCLRIEARRVLPWIKTMEWQALYKKLKRL